MTEKQIFYYKIFDDKERLNYMKTSLPHKELEDLLKEYERDHQKYFNLEFVQFLRKKDTEAELIEVSDISY